MLIRFSRKPYLNKKRELALIKENKSNFEKEQRLTRKWKMENAFDETPRLDQWDKNKKKSLIAIESLLLSNIGLADGLQTALTNINKGLNLKENEFNQEAFDDLAYNIYLVKLADLICSDIGANLKESDRDLVLRAVIGQLFPQPALVSQSQSRKVANGESLIEKLAAIRSQSNRL